MDKVEDDIIWALMADLGYYIGPQQIEFYIPESAIILPTLSLEEVQLLYVGKVFISWIDKSDNRMWRYNLETESLCVMTKGEWVLEMTIEKERILKLLEISGDQ